jgi:thiamine biosynthesis lipoprotein
VLLTAAILATSLAGTAPVPARVERSVFLMGTRLDLVVEGVTREAAMAASEVALEALENAEARLSTWRDGSELAALNRSPVGSEHRVSPALWRELAGAVECSERTGGAFDPSVGPLLEVWGVRDGGRRPLPAELERARAAVGLGALELRPGGVAVRRRPELRLEEGGFGKGAGLDRAVERIGATPGVTRAYLDLGGQVAVWASPASDPMPVEITVADPARRTEPVLAIEVAGGSVSTTGNSERGLLVDGQRVSHVLDPRTGLPARDIGSVTVWAATAFEADCLSTGLYVLGVEGISRWAAAHPEARVVVLRGEREKGRRVALVSAALAQRVSALVADLDLRRLESAGADAGDEKPPSPARATR